MNVPFLPSNEVSGSSAGGSRPVPSAWDTDSEQSSSESVGRWLHGRSVASFLLGSVAGAVTVLAATHLILPESQGPYQIVPPASAVPAEYLAAAPQNNSCLIPELPIPSGPRSFDACAFVIQSTDEIWNTRGDVDAAIEKYFHEGYFNAASWGRRGIGKAAVRAAVYSEMRAFPDIKIHITDCSCQGNDIDGYKCMMPDILEGTNTGPSAWGPATNQYARWTGLVESFVKQDAESGQWQYVAEWGVHDEWSLIQQLGLDFARVPHPPRNTEPFHDCSPILHLGQQPELDDPDMRLWKGQFGSSGR